MTIPIFRYDRDDDKDSQLFEEILYPRRIETIILIVCGQGHGQGREYGLAMGESEGIKGGSG